MKQVLDNLHVDDYLGGVDTPSSTLELWGKWKERMKEGGFQMHKWKTNSEKVLRSLRSEKNEKVMKHLPNKVWESVNNSQRC